MIDHTTKTKPASPPMQPQTEAFTAWVDASLPRIHRMSTDEAYRKEIDLVNSRLAKV
jgi:hypothetical protein